MGRSERGLVWMAARCGLEQKQNESHASVWKDYKAICINREIKLARLGENEALIDWVNHQKLADPLTCLGDGHPGIWKIVQEFNCSGEIREILDWFHLIENLHKVGGLLKRLNQAETLLWKGKLMTLWLLSLHLKLNKLKTFAISA